MSGLVLFDDHEARTFEPFALTRPISEMRAGIGIIRQRWADALGVAATGIVAAAHLEGFEEPGSPPQAPTILRAGTIIANSRCVVPLGARLAAAGSWRCGRRLAAVRLAADVPRTQLMPESALESLPAAGPAVEIVGGRWLEAVWQFITQLVPQLTDDIAALTPTLERIVPDGAIVIGRHDVVVESGANVEAAVCFDVTAGPVLVRRGALVCAFTRLVGPCAVLGGASVLGEQVGRSVIGEGSNVRGELAESILLGNANKSHEGFVGHSYLGRWVNLGAGTITSNLKNTYDDVSLWTPDGLRDSGTVKLGTFFGDHVKTGIGVRLTTGSVIGAGSNLYGSVIPPKYVPPFTWGDGTTPSPYRFDRFVATAARAMGRRQVELGDATRQLLQRAYERSWPASERS